MLTFDDEITKDRSINKKKWNGGAGDTDWCSLTGGVFGNKTGCAYMFGDVNDPCGQHYDGCTLSKTNGLEMRPRGVPSAALQTGGTTARTAKFIQKFGYWEACIKQPHNLHGEGKDLHSDFWMHPIPSMNARNKAGLTPRQKWMSMIANAQAQSHASRWPANYANSFLPLLAWLLGREK